MDSEGHLPAFAYTFRMNPWPFAKAVYLPVEKMLIGDIFHGNSRKKR